MITHSTVNTYVCVFVYGCVCIVDTLMHDFVFLFSSHSPLPSSPPSIFFISLPPLFFLEANTTSNTHDVTMWIFSVGKVTWFSSREASSSWNLGLKTIPSLHRPLHSKVIVDGVLNVTPATGQKRRRHQHTQQQSLGATSAGCFVST